MDAEALFRPTRPSRPFAVFRRAGGAAAGATEAPGPVRPPATSSLRAAPAPTRPAPAAPHTLHLFGKLREFAAIEFAIAIGVEAHRVFDKPLGRWRPTGPAWPAPPFTTTTAWTFAWSAAIGRSSGPLRRLCHGHRHERHGEHCGGCHPSDSKRTLHQSLLGQKGMGQTCSVRPKAVVCMQRCS